MQATQAIHQHSMSGLPFPYPFVDMSGFPVIYTCSPATMTTTVSPQLAPGPHHGVSRGRLASSDSTSTSLDSPASSPCPGANPGLGATHPTFCRLPYPECASFAAATSTPLDGGYKGGNRMPKPFTIEAILGLESPRCVDAALNMIVNAEVQHFKRRNSKSGRNNTNGTNASNGHKRINSNVKECRRNFNNNANIHEIREKPTKSKRVRTIFTPEQLERLEGEFERQQYMVGPERLYLAATLNLTEAQVKVWFQNRRIKWRKQHLEMQQARLAKIREDDGDPRDTFAEDLVESSDEEIQ